MAAAWLGWWLLAALPVAAQPPTPPPASPCQQPLARRPAVPPSPAAAVDVSAAAPGYAAALRPTPWGWLRQRHWCVWVDPVGGEGAARVRADQWHEAALAALAAWGQDLHLQLVDDPGAAHVLVRRQRPPLRFQAQGVERASHGRAEWQVEEVDRPGGTHLEPRVTVLVGADQRPAAMAATLLHELGHAFGLWGHSPDPNDTMTAVPGARPTLQLSPRDRLTLQWLLEQPSLLGPIRR